MMRRSELAAQIRQPLERLVVKDFGVEGREQARGRGNMLDARAGLIESRDQHRVEADGFAQSLEVLLDQRIVAVAREALEIDGGFGEQDIEAHLRPARAGREQRVTANGRPGDGLCRITCHCLPDSSGSEPLRAWRIGRCEGRSQTQSAGALQGLGSHCGHPPGRAVTLTSNIEIGGCRRRARLWHSKKADESQRNSAGFPL
jgi:hypothetical protein